MFTAPQYMQWYAQLSDPAASKQANYNLNLLESSPHSWEVAKQLICSPQSQYRSHGQQLLSKKLNFPLTPELEQNYQLLNFILSLPQLNNILYYCLAKIHLHLRYPSIQLRAPHNSKRDLLNVMKCIPDAVNTITIAPATQISKEDTERSRAEAIYTYHKELIVQSAADPALRPIVIDCIGSLTSSSMKLRSAGLVRVVLEQPIGEVYSVLEELLLSEKYPELNQQILNYLLINSSSEHVEHFYPVFLAFARSLPLFELPLDFFQQILAKILQVMGLETAMPLEQRSNCQYISDSFMFWMEVKSMIENKTRRRRKEDSEDEGEPPQGNEAPLQEKLPSEHIALAQKAFVEVWRIVIRRCVLPEIPEFREETEALSLTLSYDVDEDLEQFERAEEDLRPTNKFRSTGEDFLIMCYNVACRDEALTTELLKFIYDLSTSTQQLELELAVYVLSCIIESCRLDSIPKITQIFSSIVSNGSSSNPYIWQQLLKLMGKLSTEAMTSPAILKNTLLVIQKSLQVQQLASLASESLNSILDACSESMYKADQTPLLTELMTYVFENIYFVGNICESKSFEKMTKCFIVFIYNFKGQSFLQEYLAILHDRIASFPSESKCIIIENLALSHLFIRSEISAQYCPVLGEFCSNYIGDMAQAVAQSTRKSSLKNALFRMGSVAGIVGGYRSNAWAQAILAILKMQNKNNEMLASYISPAVKFLKVECCQESEYSSAVTDFILDSEPIITDMMLKAKPESYPIYENGLAFHFELIQRHASKVANRYNPNEVLWFICTRVLDDQLFNEFNTLRTSLALLRAVIDLNYQPQLILERVLMAYPRLAQKYWKSLEQVLLSAYRRGGSQIYHSALAKIKPEMLAPNPLFDVLMESLQKGESKSIKSLLKCL